MDKKVDCIGKYTENKKVIAGMVLTGLLLSMLAISFFYLPYEPNEMDIANSFSPPSLSHFFGTDNFGRDIFSRILKGSQPVFFVGFAAVGTGFLIGFLLGAAAGYSGGVLDEIIMRFIDANMAFPGVVLALVLITVFGSGMLNTALALGIMSVPRFCRITRGGFMQAKQMDYVKAAKARGAGHLRIILFHILPNIAPSLIVTAALGFSSSVLAEAGLSYLGLGIQPPEPSWGKMLFEAQGFMLTDPWYAMIPGGMITFLVLAFNMLSEGLREASGV